jgi:hypothetical protein
VPQPWRAIVASIDVATAACAALNFVYFSRRFTAPDYEASRRRIAAAVLAMISLGTAAEAIVLVLLAARGGPIGEASGSWALVRALPFAGTLALSALVARRLVER